MLSSIIKVLFSVYSLLLIARVLISWFPEGRNHPIVLFLGKITDPYLNVFKKFIPPIGGVMDLSPLVAFFALQLIETLLLRIL